MPSRPCAACGRFEVRHAATEMPAELVGCNHPMMAVDLEQLRVIVRDSAADLLVSAGWAPDGSPGMADEHADEERTDDAAGRWRRDLPDGFVLRVGLFRWLGADLDAGPEEEPSADPDFAVVDAVIELAYEPARRAGRAFGLLGCAGVTVGVAELAGSDADVEESVVVTTPAEARDAARALAAAITERAEAWALSFADHDALRQRIQASALERLASELRVGDAVYLAAAGRVGEAKAALVGELRAHQGRSMLLGSEVLPDVTRWLDAGAGEPADGPRRRSEPESLLGVVGSSWRYTRERRAARDSVRRAAAGAGRDEQRAAYRAELARRGILDSAAASEAFLDSLTMGRLEQTKLGLQGFRALGQVGAGLLRTIRNLGDASATDDDDEGAGVAARFVQLRPDRTPQRWHLPDHAAWPVRRFRDGGSGQPSWVPAEAEPGAGDAVMELVAEPSELAASTVLSGWLLPLEGAAGELAVYLGDERIAHLAPPMGELFHEDVELAAVLGLVPYVEVRLTRRHRPPPHVVDVRRP